MERFSGSFLETDFLKPLSGKNKAQEFLNWCFYFVLVWSSGLSADIIWIFYGHSIDFIRTVHANCILFFRSVAICTA